MTFVIVAAGLAACGGDPGAEKTSTVGTALTPATSTTLGDPPPLDPEAAAEGVGALANDAPAWLGTRVLPLRGDGYGEIQPTPAELRDRRLVTVDTLAPPPDATFKSAVVAVPAAVAARSTWDPGCPVALGDLRYVTTAFWGFDGQPHTGELLVNAEVADAVVEVFRRLHGVRFPIEEMRITRAEELDLAPTGDGNNTGSFVCRPSRGTTSWSEHAYGRAVDINPFHNPYLKAEIVLPELASAYTDRADARPGMITSDGEVTTAFSEIGWGWGGNWRSNKDYMHFSVNGR